MTEAELDNLLVRFADGTLDAPSGALLEAELAQNPAARTRLRELSEQVFAIGEAGRCREARRPRPLATAPAKTSWFRQGWAVGLAAAAAIVVLLAVAQHRPKTDYLQVTGVHGGAVWTNGQQRVPLVVGAHLPAGTVETENEAATAEVRLADGTHFTLHGSAEAEFTDGPEKQVTLKRGNFTAFVAKQASGHPLRVRTPAANLEVLGTDFSLEADPARTSLTVSEGRVRLRRLVDGREVEVGAEQQAAASLVTTDALVAQTMKAPSTKWTHPFDNYEERLTGTWTAASGLDPVRIAAVPVVEKRKDDGSLQVHHSVIVRALSNAPADAFATITPDSVLRLRLRLNKQLPIQLMIATRRPDGAFAGNFESVKLYPHVAAGPDWQAVEVPIREFIPIHPERCQSAAGNQANVVIISTLHESVGMEVAEMAILPQSSAL